MAKVLVIRTSSLGDVALLVPVVASVAAKYPQDRFSVMTRNAYAPLFQNLGFNINVIPLDLKHKHGGILGIFRIIGKGISQRFTHVADEHDVLRSKILRKVMFLKTAKVAHIDKGRAEKNRLIETKNLIPALKTTVQRYLDVFEKLGFPAEITFTNFFTFIPRNFSELKPLVKEKKGKWIGVAPFSKHEGKIYPLAKMEEIVKRLSEEGHTVFLFGAGKYEKEVLDKWTSLYENVINTSGVFKLGREMILISYLDVMLSMDSANMHLASLVEVPVVSVWGATHPAVGFYGFNQDSDNAVQIDLDCRPCSVYGDLPCQRYDYACMTQLPESMILDKIHEVLRSQTS